MIFKYKSRSLTKDLENIGAIAETSTIEIIKEKKIDIPGIEEFTKELISFKKCQVEDIFFKEVKTDLFNYDIPNFLNNIQSKEEDLNLNHYKLSYSRKFEFKLNSDQFNQIKSYNSLFGTKIDGISRTLSRVYIKKLFRKYEKDRIEEIAEYSEKNSRRWGGGLESI